MTTPANQDDATTYTNNGSNNHRDEPPNKRLKKSDDNNNVMDILAPQEEQQLRDLYKTAKPYPHGRIEGLFVDGFLEQVLEEIKNNSKVKFKESDLFRVYQSIDLGNLSSPDDSPQKQQEALLIQQQLPNLMKLKTAIYSAEYRAFVERICHLEPGTLTDQVDCAANCHAPGCHLLCHDDVIGTRKVSYIIYLTDPTPNWEASEGGSLELYDSDVVTTKEGQQQRVPQVFPSKTILPTFNTMAYFVVEPGVSFHAVQEVFGDRPRLSIQGWYHAKEVPSQIENATLSRLKSTAKGEDTEGSFTPMVQQSGGSKIATTAAAATSNDDEQPMMLSRSDCQYLSKFINDVYLTPNAMQEIRDRFEEESSVQLRDFFRQEWLQKSNHAISEQDKACQLGKGQPGVLDYHVGIDDKNWKAVGPAHKQRFLEYVGGDGNNNEGKTTGDNNDDFSEAGALLQHLKRVVFESAEFGRFLKCITSLGMPLGYRGRVRRFRPGLDYTVAHYGILTTKAVLDATLCFVAAGSSGHQQCRKVNEEKAGDLIGDGPNNANEDALMWESGDYGGFECYIAADDDDDQDDDGDKKHEAAAEYDDQDDSELLSVSASNNTLSLVYRDPGTMRFVKYVGSGAPSSRWDISMEYEVEETAEDDKDSVSEEK